MFPPRRARNRPRAYTRSSSEHEKCQKNLRLSCLICRRKRRLAISDVTCAIVTCCYVRMRSRIAREMAPTKMTRAITATWSQRLAFVFGAARTDQRAAIYRPARYRGLLYALARERCCWRRITEPTNPGNRQQEKDRSTHQARVSGGELIRLRLRLT